MSGFNNINGISEDFNLEGLKTFYGFTKYSSENLIKEYNDLVEKRKQKSSKPVTPDTPSIIIDGSPIKYTPGILSFPSPTKSIQEGGSNKNNKKVYKTPRKWSKEYCKRTSCDRMGFSQKSSCRPYKNCYK